MGNIKRVNRGWIQNSARALVNKVRENRCIGNQIVDRRQRSLPACAMGFVCGGEGRVSGDVD
jgi:hypothetical protein